MRCSILILIVFFFYHSGSSQGIEFFEGTFDEALKKAKEEDKIVFIDAYTTWCGPCKRMKKYIFPNQKAGDFYNKYFISMAIDMEKQMGKELNMAYPVRAYPTFLFIDDEGKLVHQEVGGKPIELFIQMGESALKADDKSEDYAKIYESGERDYDFVLKYVNALNRADKSSAPIVYDFLKNAKDLSLEDKARFIFDATCCSDSKLFDMLTEKKTKKALIKMYSEERYAEKISDVCWATVKKGMEYNVEDLYKEAKAKYKKQLKKSYPKFSLEVDLAVAKRNMDASLYLKAAKKYEKYLDNSKQKNEFALKSRDAFLKNKGIGKFSEDLSYSALKKEKNIENHHIYGKVLLMNSKFNEAKIILEKALEMAKEEGGYPKFKELEQLLKRTEYTIKKQKR